MKLILASQSPRRHELLKNVGYDFDVLTVKVSEILKENLNLAEQIMAVAETKGVSVAQSGKLLKNKNYLIFSADTLVILEGQVMGKPKNLQEAEKFIRRLSGRTHSVITGICFLLYPSLQSFKYCEESKVTFRDLSEDEIKNYASTKEGLDKAGGYAIQEKGSALVKEVQGSLTNIIGLPMELFEKVMKENGWDKYFRKS